ncbi:magnesium and cobalt transport protein CorA [Nonomuraea sp. NPDC050680]|uniref:magnesium and cobalt transport protein CorA n=1 Tax=Nonomuraea sp. NPDC050680 TaxID=3154630 RepID=UPI0034028EA2
MLCSRPVPRGRGETSARHGQANPLTGVRRRIESDPDLLAAGPSGVLYAICDQVVDTYSQISHEVEHDLIVLERRVFSGEQADVTEDIYSLKREVLEFRAAQDPLVPVLEEIVKGRVELCTVARDQFRDVLDHLLRVDAQVDEHNELLTSALSAHLALVSREQSAAAIQQNVDMRKISSWAALIAVPTMIAGIYGMNFDYVPELHWLLGYPLSLSVMVIATVIVHRVERMLRPFGIGRPQPHLLGLQGRDRHSRVGLLEGALRRDRPRCNPAARQSPRNRFLTSRKKTESVRFRGHLTHRSREHVRFRKRLI